jgi:hypothetical protein
MHERDVVRMPPLSGKMHPAVVLRVVEDRSKGIVIFGTGTGPYAPQYIGVAHCEVAPKPSLNGTRLDLHKPTFFYLTNTRWCDAKSATFAMLRCPMELWFKLYEIAEQSALAPTATIPIAAP